MLGVIRHRGKMGGQVDDKSTKTARKVAEALRDVAAIPASSNAKNGEKKHLYHLLTHTPVCPPLCHADGHLAGGYWVNSALVTASEAL